MFALDLTLSLTFILKETDQKTIHTEYPPQEKKRIHYCFSFFSPEGGHGQRRESSEGGPHSKQRRRARH